MFPLHLLIINPTCRFTQATFARLLEHIFFPYITMTIKHSCYCLIQTFLVFLFFTLLTASEVWSNVDSGKWARSSLGKTYWTAPLKPLPIDWEDWGQEEKGVTEEDGWMASLTQWTWVWANSRRWWRTGKSGVLQSMRLQRVADLATEKQQECHSKLW